ncbi:collagenase-like protease [Pontibacillus yanchengensis]|uniref:Collagenase-like protease n=1 Tax=Pontibacillus yanchengensis TaxID=462910 RepID=A0A6I5A3G6_9BACI|nr:U32 family peptidase [Pontibacillus yanchengensis]MYL33379.1 collagenase-like protease [Pontibacillus yanchengensis]
MALEQISKVIDGKRKIVKKPELLAPAGNLEKLKIAVRYGADAVFIGGKDFGLRSNADNFSIEEMAEGVEFANSFNARIYVTTNIYAHNENMSGLEEYLKDIQGAGVSGIIVADPLIIETCKRVAPNLEVHLSTQQSLSNWKAVQFWKEEGLERVVTARETGHEEIKQMKEKVDIEIEAFIHGAMCISYSGRCTLSNHMTARDSNRGGCCQSCRWDYDLMVDTGNQQQEDQAMFTDPSAPFAMSPKDLNLIMSIPKMCDIGIDSLKIEGRMKSIHYVATVVGVYRKVIDAYCDNPDNFQINPKWVEELAKCANRDTASAFYEGTPSYKEQMYGEDNQSRKTNYVFSGLVLDFDLETNIATIQQRNYFKPGDTIEFFGPESDGFTQIVGTIWDEKDNQMEAARHPLQIVKIKVDQPVYPYNMMRKNKGKEHQTS